MGRIVQLPSNAQSADSKSRGQATDSKVIYFQRESLGRKCRELANLMLNEGPTLTAFQYQAVLEEWGRAVSAYGEKYGPHSTTELFYDILDNKNNCLPEEEVI